MRLIVDACRLSFQRATLLSRQQCSAWRGNVVATRVLDTFSPPRNDYPGHEKVRHARCRGLSGTIKAIRAETGLLYTRFAERLFLFLFAIARLFLAPDPAPAGGRAVKPESSLRE